MRLVSTGSVSVSRVPLPRKLLGQVLHQDSVAVGTEEDMSLGSGQSPGEGADPHASPGRRPPPPDDAQPPAPGRRPVSASWPCGDPRPAVLALESPWRQGAPQYLAEPQPAWKESWKHS